MTQLRALYLLILRSVASRGRVVALGALSALGIVVAALIDADARGAARFVDGFGLVVVVPLTTLVFASAALGDIIDDGTMVYLWLRPVRRWKIVVAAALATITVVIPVVVVPVMVAAALTGTGTDLVVGAGVASLLGTVAYAGIFVMLGIRVRRALLWGLLYVFIWEGFVARAGDTANRLAIRAYTRSVLSDIALSGARPLRQATISPAFAYTVPLAVCAVALAYATRRLTRQDVA